MLTISFYTLNVILIVLNALLGVRNKWFQSIVGLQACWCIAMGFMWYAHSQAGTPADYKLEVTWSCSCVLVVLSYIHRAQTETYADIHKLIMLLWALVLTLIAIS